MLTTTTITAGDEEIAALQVLVEPGPRAEIDQAGLAPHAQPVREALHQELLRHPVDDPRRVAHDDRGGVRVAAVEDELDPGRAPGPQVLGVAALDVQDDARAAAVDRFPRLGVVLHVLRRRRSSPC